MNWVKARPFGLGYNEVLQKTEHPVLGAGVRQVWVASQLWRGGLCLTPYTQQTGVFSVGGGVRVQEPPPLLSRGTHTERTRSQQDKLTLIFWESTPLCASTVHTSIS